MRPAYVRVELGDPEDAKAPSFVVSPVPFVWHYGNILIPTKADQRKAPSYAELCTILTKDFHVPKTLLPPERYFNPTRDEKQEECWDVYRTVPEGTGEPEWRSDTRQALILLLEETQFSSEKGWCQLTTATAIPWRNYIKNWRQLRSKLAEEKRSKAELTSWITTCS